MDYWDGAANEPMWDETIRWAESRKLALLKSPATGHSAIHTWPLYLNQYLKYNMKALAVENHVLITWDVYNKHRTMIQHKTNSWNRTNSWNVIRCQISMLYKHNILLYFCSMCFQPLFLNCTKLCVRSQTLLFIKPPLLN